MATLVATWDLSIDKAVTKDTNLYTDIKKAAEATPAGWDTSGTSSAVGVGDVPALIQGAEAMLAVLRAGAAKPGVTVNVVHITLYPN